MRVADNGADAMSAPANYADLFSRYYSYVVTLVRRAGIEPSRVEDVAMEIMTRFYERDFLTEFDPTLVFHYDGEDRPARFKSFFTKIVLVYLRGHVDKQRRLATRELLLCDRPIGSNSASQAPGNATWIEVFGESVDGADDEVLASLSEQELVDRLRAYIAEVPRRSPYDTCDLVALFDAVVAQVRAEGAWNVTALRQHFGISSTAMHSWMWWLRTNLAAALDRPVPAKRARTVRPRPARQAGPA